MAFLENKTRESASSEAKPEESVDRHSQMQFCFRSRSFCVLDLITKVCQQRPTLSLRKKHENDKKQRQTSWIIYQCAGKPGTMMTTSSNCPSLAPRTQVCKIKLYSSLDDTRTRTPLLRFRGLLLDSPLESTCSSQPQDTSSLERILAGGNSPSEARVTTWARTMFTLQK